jgi:hypothetical protein
MRIIAIISLAFTLLIAGCGGKSDAQRRHPHGEQFHNQLKFEDAVASQVGEEVHCIKTSSKAAICAGETGSYHVTCQYADAEGGHDCIIEQN